VFCQSDGRPWNPDHASKRLKKLVAQAGVPVVTLHEGGRHTANSLMQEAGVDQELRMRQVGRADRSVTTATRTRWAGGSGRVTADNEAGAKGEKPHDQDGCSHIVLPEDGAARSQSSPREVHCRSEFFSNNICGAGWARTHDRQIMSKLAWPESPLAGCLLTKSRLVSRDAAGSMRTGRDLPERDECSHNVLTRRPDQGSLAWVNWLAPLDAKRPAGSLRPAGRSHV
jgi:hypothetical protein